MKYSLEDLPHLEQEYEDRYHAAVEELSTSLEAIDTLLQITQHRLTLEEKEKVSLEDISNLKSMIEIGLGLESHDMGQLFPALEDVSEPEESMEYMDRTIGEKLGYLGRVGLNAIKGLGEFLRYSVNIINLLSKEYDKSVEAVGDFDKVSTILRNNEYFCYGDNKRQVKNIQDYIEQLDKSVSLLITVADTMGQYTRDSFLDNLKVFAAYATFMKGKVFNGMFDDLYKLTNRITDHPMMKKQSDEYDYGFNQYVSDVMLGMFKVEVTQMPKSKDPDYLSIDSKRKYAKIMKLSVNHYVTKKPVKTDPQIEFEATKKDFDRINDIVRPLLASYDKFNSNLLRLTLAEKVFNVVEPILTYKKSMSIAGKATMDAMTNLYNNPNIPDHVLDNIEDTVYKGFNYAKYGYTIDRLIMFKVFVNYNILIRSSMMIIRTNHTIFSLLRGHIKNAIEINKKLTAQQG